MSSKEVEVEGLLVVVIGEEEVEENEKEHLREQFN